MLVGLMVFAYNDMYIMCLLNILIDIFTETVDNIVINLTFLGIDGFTWGDIVDMHHCKDKVANLTVNETRSDWLTRPALVGAQAPSPHCMTAD